MDQMQCAYLQALEIPLWVSRDSTQKGNSWLYRAKQTDYLCLMAPQEWENPELRQLFSNMIDALRWPKNRCSVLSVSLPTEVMSMVSLDNYKVIVSFGIEVLEHAVNIPSLSDMQNQTHLKKQAWALLKPYCI